MTRYLTQLGPSSVDDLAAMVSLYRPGPMANIESYIEAKRTPPRSDTSIPSWSRSCGRPTA